MSNCSVNGALYGNASASSGSSWNSSSNDTEDDHAIATILAEEERLKHDAKLVKMLSLLGSILHIPQVIGGIPGANYDATLDHERLSKSYLFRSLNKSISMLQIENLFTPAESDLVRIEDKPDYSYLKRLFWDLIIREDKDN